MQFSTYILPSLCIKTEDGLPVTTQTFLRALFVDLITLLCKELDYTHLFREGFCIAFYFAIAISLKLKIGGRL